MSSSYFLGWSKGISYEKAFWRKWLETGGGRWPEEFARCSVPAFDGLDR